MAARSTRATSHECPPDDREPCSLAERILHAARAHFFRFGFAGSTMDDLASELGMSKKTLYQHFRSKDSIVDALIRAKAARVVGGLDAILDTPGLTFAERVSRVLAHLHAQLGEINAVFLRDLRRFVPAVYARVEEMRAQTIPRVWERLLREGMEAGAVRADLDVRFTARMIQVLMQHLMQPENLERLGVQPPEMMARFFNLIFTGMLTRAGLHDYEKHRPYFGTQPPVV